MSQPNASAPWRVAFAQRFTAERPIVVLIALRITPQTQFERIELERDRKLVHRGFERKHRGWGTWRAHVACGRKIEPCELVLVFCIGAFVEQARPPGLLPEVFLVLRGHGDRVMHDRVESSVGVGAELNPLNHRGSVAQYVHLRPRQHDTHRALQRARCEHRQHHLKLRAQARAESAAHERRHHPHILGLHAEHAAEIALDVLHALCLVVDRELAVAP